jgi:hypothetical protein
VLAAVAAAGLLAGAGSAEPASQSLPERVAVDARYQSPHHTILRGHADDWDGIADLLEDLGRNPQAPEPVLRQITCSERGYEFTILVPKEVPAPAAPRPEEQVPFFAAHPVAWSLFRLLVPPFT